jgi:hypothetical protein
MIGEWLQSIRMRRMHRKLNKMLYSFHTPEYKEKDDDSGDDY